MNKLLKSILDTIWLIIGLVFGIPILCVLCIVYMFYVPFDIIRYHKMPYYRDLKKKYEFFITSGEVVKFYNYIANEKLSIKYFQNEDYEYFVKDGEVLLCGWTGFDFRKKNDEWIWNLDKEVEENNMSILEILELDREMLKPEHRDLPEKIIMLYDKKKPKKMERIKECPYFYFVSL